MVNVPKYLYALNKPEIAISITPPSTLKNKLRSNKVGFASSVIAPASTIALCLLYTNTIPKESNNKEKRIKPHWESVGVAGTDKVAVTVYASKKTYPKPTV